MNIWKNRDWHPMLLNKLDKPFDSDEYLYELKFDGIRAIIFVSPQEVMIKSRNNVDLTRLFPELSSLKELVKNDVIFDGELIIFNDGKPVFSKIQKRVRLKSKKSIEYYSISEPAVFMAFDILYDKKDLTTTPLFERKKILNKIRDSDVFMKVKIVDKKGCKFFDAIRKANLEGMVAKNKLGLYHINKRTSDFIKIKNNMREQFIIGGYKENKNNTMSVALLERKLNKFSLVGFVSVSKNSKLFTRLLNMGNTKPFFECDKDITFIKPFVQCQVSYLEKTSKGLLRHAKLVEGDDL